MDGVRWIAAARKTCLRVTGLQPARPGSRPKTPAKHSDSNLRGLPCSVGLACALTHGIEFPGRDVGFELPVTRCSVELGKPPAKGRELVSRQALNLTHEITDPTHCAPLECTGDYTAGRPRFAPAQETPPASLPFEQHRELNLTPFLCISSRHFVSNTTEN